MTDLIDRAFLNANTDGVDANLQGKRSLFLGRPITMSSNFLFGFQDIEASPPGGYGANSTFEVTQDADYLGPMELVYDFGAVSSTGSGLLYPRYVDWLGCAAVENVRVRWGANRSQEFNGDQIMVLHALKKRTDDKFSKLAAGGLQSLPATRQANAAKSSFKVYVPLTCLLWGNQPGNFLPYNQEVLRDHFTFTVKTRPKTSLIETDGSDITASINSVVLRLHKVHVTDREHAEILRYLQRPTPELNLMAAARMCTVQEEQEEEVVAATTNDQKYTLTANRPTKEIIAYWRKDSDLPTGSISSDIKHYNFQPIDEIQLKGISRNIFDRVDGEWVKHSLANKFHSGDPGKNIYAIPFSMAPEADNDQFGYLNFATVSQPKLTIKTDGAAAGKLSVIYQTLNSYIMTEGDFRILNA